MIERLRHYQRALEALAAFGLSLDSEPPGQRIRLAGRNYTITSIGYERGTLHIHLDSSLTIYWQPDRGTWAIKD